MHRIRTWPTISSPPAFRQRSRVAPMAQPSDANLSFDFTTGVMPSGFTTTRTSASATRVNRFGFIETVAANTARMNHDPANLSAGSSLLIEGSATNLCLESQTIHVGPTWGGNVGGCVATANTTDVTSPANNNTATRLACTGGVYCSWFQTITVTPSTTYTWSFWIRGASGSAARIFDATNLADIATQTAYTYTNTGWTRVQTTFTAPVGCLSVYAYVSNWTPGSTQNIYVWGAQLEVGISPSSYVPTTTTAVTRDADLVSLAWNEASRLWNTTQGTMFVEARMNRFKPVDAPSFFPKLVAFTASGASRFGLAYNPDALLEALVSELSITGGVGTIYSPPVGGYAYSSNVNFRVAFSALGTVTLRSAFNGTTQTQATDTLAPILGSVNGLQFNPGQDGTCPTANIRAVRYWNRSFSQAELNALTR